MKIHLTDIDLTKILDALKSNEFGIDVAMSSNEQIIGAEVWTEGTPDGTNLGGFLCGRIVRSGSYHFPRYEIEIDDGRVNRSRVHGLMTDLLNATWRA